MNLVLIEPSDFLSSRRIRLSDRRFLHIRNVLKPQSGQPIRVGLVGGNIGCGIIRVLTDSEVELDVDLTQPPPSASDITVLLALPRPKVMKRLLQALASMGIKRIVLLNAAGVDKSYWQSPLLSPPQIRDQFLLGLEQAGDTILPDITLVRRFKPFVEDVLPGMAARTCALVAQPGASHPCPANVKNQVLLIVGPERGFTPFELNLLTEAGMTPVHLGMRPLRVEAAVPALLGRLQPLR